MGGVPVTRTPLLTFEDWRTMRWGGPSAAPSGPDEAMEYRRYLDENCGLPQMDW